MIEGRRARSVRGSPHSDRPLRRGASVTGVCQCASRAFSLWCRVSTACTDGSSPEHWLGRSSYPGLGSRRNSNAVRDSCSTSARVRGPPRVLVHRRRLKNGLTNESSWKRTYMPHRRSDAIHSLLVRATRWNVATVHAGESGMCKPLRIHTSANSENVLKVSPAAGTALMPLRLITTVAKDKILRTCCQSN